MSMQFRRRGTAVLVIVASVGIGITACALYFTRNVPPRTIGEAIVIVPSEVIVEGEGPQEAVLRLRNTTNYAIRVTHIVPSCGCTIASIPDINPVPPQGESLLKVKATPPQVGQAHSRIDIHYDSPGKSALASASILLNGGEPTLPTLAEPVRDLIIRGLLVGQRHFGRVSERQVVSRKAVACRLSGGSVLEW